MVRIGAAQEPSEAGRSRVASFLRPTARPTDDRATGRVLVLANGYP